MKSETGQADGEGAPDGRLAPQEAGARFAVPAICGGRRQLIG